MVLGLLLCLPQFWIRAENPRYLPSTNLPLHAVWAIGDTLSHAGLMMLVYWDICIEAVRLVYALEPKRQRIGLKVCKTVGTISVGAQVVFLVPFWTLVYLLETSNARAVLSGTFYVVQCYSFFGLVPAVGFAVLFKGLRRLRSKLPGDIPRHLLHRLRFTQLAIGVFLLIGVLDALFALLPAAEPFVRSLSGTLYTCFVLVCFALFSLVLLTLEVILSFQDATKNSTSKIFLDPQRLATFVRHGVATLAAAGKPLTHSVPVWHRGISQSVATGFHDVCLMEGQSQEEPTTSDLCVELIRPMTLPAHCSVWEGLAVGLTSQSSSSKQKMSCDHVGEPTVMVSHSWSSPYIHLTAILKRYDENTNTNNFFWLDIFSMNQHDFADLSGVQASDPMDGSIASMYDTMLQALTQAIKVPNCMLLALIPHERPALLTRAWCLYEIYIAWKVGAEVACGFVPEAEQSVKKSLLKDDMLINQIIDSVDAKESRATKNSDREMILDLIAEAGVDRFNSFVRQKLEASLRLVAVTTLLNVSTTNVEVVPELPSREASIATRSQYIHENFDFHSEGTSFSI